LVWREAAAAPAGSPPRERRSHGSWRGRLELGFEKRADKTVVAHRRHSGPLTIQKPFYPEAGGICHVYLLHPPGGMAGGDSLELEVNVARSAHALITTPAAGKFYRCNGKQAALQQKLTVQAGSMLEWLPQETIVFDGSEARLVSRVELATDSRFIGWEIVCLGRPAANEGFSRGNYRQRFEIWRSDRPLLIERSLFQGGDALLAATWGLQAYSVSATLIALPVDESVLAQVRAGVRLENPGLFSATLINGTLICRYLGGQAEHARRAFIAAWRVIRPQLSGQPACEPRIWAT
jgi:urease accessory protein